MFDFDLNDNLDKIWSSIIKLKSKTIYLASGNPKDTYYFLDKRN